jgi:predicted metal-dependent hydrolase
MSDLIVRKLLIDLEAPFELRWNGGDAFTSAFMNALSMSFPVGEQFFIDSLRRAQPELSPELQAHFATELKGFIGQEATHRRLHSLFNQHLENQGQLNHWGPRALKRVHQMEKLDVRHGVAATAATEHFTAVLAHWLLSNPDFMSKAEPRLQTLWQWHASEESEHRCTAFDIYKALNGNEEWRLRWMRLITLFLMTDLLRQTVNNLWHDASLFKFNTWRSAWVFLFAKQGLFRSSFPMWRAYFRPDFHPAQHDDQLSRQWLQTHQQSYQAIGQSA